MKLNAIPPGWVIIAGLLLTQGCSPAPHSPLPSNNVSATGRSSCADELLTLPRPYTDLFPATPALKGRPFRAEYTAFVIIRENPGGKPSACVTHGQVARDANGNVVSVRFETTSVALNDDLANTTKTLAAFDKVASASGNTALQSRREIGSGYIYDPARKIMSTWDERTGTLTRSREPLPARILSCNALLCSGQFWSGLGTSKLEGVPVDGCGAKFPPRQPYLPIASEEIWQSDQLRIVVRMTKRDAQGRLIGAYWLHRIVPGPPDAAAFRVPARYPVVDKYADWLRTVRPENRVPDPSGFTGLWEMPAPRRPGVARQEIVGINFELGGIHHHSAEFYESLQADFYRRIHGTLHWYPVSVDRPDHWNAIQLHLVPPPWLGQSLTLKYHGRSRGWTGTLVTNGKRYPVVLSRPRNLSPADRFLGDWQVLRTPDGPGLRPDSSLHIALGRDRKLLAWKDLAGGPDFLGDQYGLPLKFGGRDAHAAWFEAAWPNPVDPNRVPPDKLSITSRPGVMRWQGGVMSYLVKRATPAGIH